MPPNDSSSSESRPSTTNATTNANANDDNDIIPQLQNYGITFGQLNTAVKVLTAVLALESESSSSSSSKDHKRKANQISSTDTERANSADKKKDMNHGEQQAQQQQQQQQQHTSPYQHVHLRPLRKVLAQCISMHQRTMYDGKSPTEYYQGKLQERTLKRQKHAETVQQRKYIAETALRRGRVERLQEKQKEAMEEEMLKLQHHTNKHSAMLNLMIPDGHVETTTITNDEQQQQQQQQQQSSNPSVQLPKLRSCYVCKMRFRDLHFFYDQLCPACAALNFEKRHQTCSLQGKVAIVTGSRVKIGYQTCLKLLRAGATVIATTRFPNAAALAYRQEADFDTFQDRLQVYGLDLRDVTGIEAFCRFLKQQYADKGIDILINNACQTVRRPTAYYLPACQKEETLWKQGDETHKKLLHGCLQFESVRRRLALDHQLHDSTTTPSLTAGAAAGVAATPMITAGNLDTTGSSSSVTQPNTTQSEASNVVVMSVEEEEEDHAINGNNTETALTVREEKTNQTKVEVPFEHTGISHSAAMSQMVLLPEDAGVSDSVLPPGVTDINGQQLDLRKTNSWLLKMEQVSTPEVMECMFINAIAPFVLNSRLKPLMSVYDTTTTTSRPNRYIINVSAMEGKFYRYKMPNHPHTNMAKAALNMMTRTSAEDLAKNHSIYMNSVDTGWINDENPLEKASNTAQNNHFQTPIDEIDAAARILDPIFSDVNVQSNHQQPPQKQNDNENPNNHGRNNMKYTPLYGKFLKDYRETEW